MKFDIKLSVETKNFSIFLFYSSDFHCLILNSIQRHEKPSKAKKLSLCYIFSICSILTVAVRLVFFFPVLINCISNNIWHYMLNYTAVTRVEMELIKIDSNGKRIYEIGFNGKNWRNRFQWFFNGFLTLQPETLPEVELILNMRNRLQIISKLSNGYLTKIKKIE